MIKIKYEEELKYIEKNIKRTSISLEHAKKKSNARNQNEIDFLKRRLIILKNIKNIILDKDLNKLHVEEELYDN